ncbi:hypothetical protein [Aureimonas leprariae]|nr:hypothetical protein [Aureimonas leprariae]
MLDAIVWEKQIEVWSRAKKEALIALTTKPCRLYCATVRTMC